MTVWMEQGSAPDQPGARWIVPQRVDNQHPLTNEGSILAAFTGWVTHSRAICNVAGWEDAMDGLTPTRYLWLQAAQPTRCLQNLTDE